MPETVTSITDKEVGRVTNMKDRQRLVEAGVYSKVEHALNESGIHLPKKSGAKIDIFHPLESETVERVRTIVARVVGRIVKEKGIGTR